MTSNLEELVETAANELGEKIASEAESAEEYAEGLELAIDILQIAANAAWGR